MALSNFLFFNPTNFFSPVTFTKQPVRIHISRSRPAQCTTDSGKLPEQIPMRVNKLHEQMSVRRSGNYPPSLWEFEHLQSLNNPYAGEIYVKRTEELKEIVREMLEEVHKEPLDLLELIDDLQRLGLSYQFESKIKQVLTTIYNKYSNNTFLLEENSLYAQALTFRLFRQHGFNVSPEIFDCFKDEKFGFKTNLCEDTKGMLYLYEASYLAVEDEITLDLAREFTTKHLKKNLDNDKIDRNLAALVNHALELPLHWRLARLEARWFIDIYEARADMNPLLSELAKLDFNIVQAKYQEDLKHIARWLKDTRLSEQLTYVRDCLVSAFFWATGMIDEPQCGDARRMLAKINTLITFVDDTYDIFGTLDELKHFTDAIERWDVNAMDQLPSYMKACFLELYNFAHEISSDALKEHGIQTIRYQKKMWEDLCKSYLQEAKWYFNGYKPTLEEYMSNAWLSVSAHVILIHAYIGTAKPIQREALEGCYNYHDVIRCSTILTRLANDLGTSSDELERGDISKCVQCYMFETGASEEKAREYIKVLILEKWKKMNKYLAADSPFSQSFIRIIMNSIRVGQCLYEFGDGYGKDFISQDQVSSILLESIPVKNM